MIEIGMYQVSKNFGYKQVLNTISFEIYKGSRLGIVGKNGSGKSTLFKMIMKKEYPDTGSINIRKQTSIGYLEQIPSLMHTNLTTKDVLMESFTALSQIEQRMRVLEEQMAKELDEDVLNSVLDTYAKVQNQFINAGGYEIEEKLSKVIHAFHLENILETPFNVLSGGQKTIVNLAKLLICEPDILLLDEPTNHLDMKMMEWLEGYLSKYRGTIVLISHDRYFLDRVTNKTLMLDSGQCHLYHGNYSYSLKEQERLLLLEFEQYKNQQKKIEAMKTAIKRYRDWGNQGDNPKFFKKAKELENRLEKIEWIDKPQLEKIKLPIHFHEERISREVLKLKNFSLAFPNQILLQDVSCTLYYQEKVALLGDNGTGKSTFIKALVGELKNYTGEMDMAANIRIGYIPQEIRFSDDKDTILTAFRKEYPCLEGEARGILSKYSFYKDLVFKSVGTLSGGEKVLLKLAILIQQEVNYLLLDEPTNHIDIDTREVLEQALMDYKGTLLFVSHDRYFIDIIASRILEIKNHKLHNFYGKYADYIQRNE